MTPMGIRGRFRLSVCGALCALTLTSPVRSHHSYAVFDRDREITLQGTVRTWEMGNPHAYLWIYVNDRKGKQQIWGLEAPGPSVLVRNGWSKYSVKAGDKITVTLNPLRDGRTGGNLTSVRFADGRFLDTRPNDKREPPVPHTVSPAPRANAQ